MNPVKDIIILGGGSAGLMAALILRKRLPGLNVRVIRSPDIGIIGVGEGTTNQFPRYFFNELRLDPWRFYKEAAPTWKLGLRLQWGPRDHFHYIFAEELDTRLPGLSRNTGFYCQDDMTNIGIWHALAAADKALPRTAAGQPYFHRHENLAFHVENRKLVAWLEWVCRAHKVRFTEGTVREVEHGPGGVTALHLEDGQRHTADLFVDASGFRSELLGRTLEVPFQSYSHALFCDRAVIGGWPRSGEIIRPVTTCETMDAGWCWQIEHEHFINRGYVYSSAFLSDDDARAELLRKNTRIPPDQTRVVKFRSGRYVRAWEENVVSVGNATGFVEPLEATALACIVAQADTLAVSLTDSECRPTPTVRDLYNRFTAAQWDEIRDFLAVHYRFNTRLDTPFWQHCRRETPLGSAEPIAAFYAENGPSGLPKSVFLPRNATIAWEGWMAILTGLRVPHARPCTPTPAESQALARHRAEMTRVAQNGFTVAAALAIIRQPDWRWE